jgi:SAM-dependent methyltransferase
MSGLGLSPQACIACGHAPRPTFRLSNGSWLLRCPRCLLGWWAWPPFDPSAFYDRDYFQSGALPKGYDDYAGLEAGVARTARGRLRRIDHLAPPRAGDRPRLLEIGCGTGVFLNCARAAGWTAAGVEVSAYAAEQARRRGFDVICQPIEDLQLPTVAYDCVALWDVVEHLRDPPRALQTATQALRPGGILALSTGDVTSLCARASGPRWHLFNVPEHLYFFSLAALTRLLARFGCRIVCVTRELNWVPVRYLFERLRKSLGWPESAARRIARMPAWVVPATLGDVLGVYAVRRG